MSARLVVISGMSGAGKSSALKCFEDLGYYCVDNLPPTLIPTVLDLCGRSTPRVRHVALAIDARTRDFLEQFVPVWSEVRQRDPAARLLFFDAEDGILVQRFSETRRPHPLAPRGTVEQGIQAEREILGPVRTLADHVVETSTFNVRELRDFLLDRFRRGPRKLNIAVTSFGFSQGVPDNADLVLDVRFLPNPHYDADLRPLCGLDKPVRTFVESRTDTQQFLAHVESLLQFLLPRYAQEGKSYLTIAIGCTGGRHRSVAIAEMIAESLRRQGYPLSVVHSHLPAQALPSPVPSDSLEEP